jgi:hypothetical protein
MALGQYLGIAGTVVGAVIGGVIGAPFGATFQGAMIGATLGGAAGGIAGQVWFPEKPDYKSTPPPQSRENRVQVSSYGAMIPKIDGAKRLAGNIIYAGPEVLTVVQSRHRQEGVRYYENERIYTRTLVVLFCEGEAAGIGRIWVENQVFVDFRDPSGAYFPPNSGEQARANLDASNNLAGQYFTIYYGTETQNPDPTYEAAVGAGLAPAFRGWCYIVFPDFPTGKFGSIPNIEAEIIKTGSAVTAQAEINLETIFGEYTTLQLQAHMWTAEGNLVILRNNATREFVVLKGFTNTVIERFFIPPVASENAGNVGGWGVNPRTGRFYVTVNFQYSTSRFKRRNLIYDRPNGQLVYDQERSYDISSQPHAWACMKILFDASDRPWMVYSTLASGWNTYYGLMRCDDNIDADGLGGFQSYRFYRSDGSYIDFSSTGIWSSDGTNFYYAAGSAAWEPGGTAGYWIVRVNPAMIQSTAGYPNATRVIIPYGAWEKVRTHANTAMDLPYAWSNGVGFPSTAYITEAVYDGGQKIRMYQAIASPVNYNRAFAGEDEATLDQVVKNYCTEAGIAALDVNSAALESDLVLGYGVTRQMPARTAIEPLMQPYQFDMAEIDWQLKAVKRGGASAVTIPDADLGAVPYGAESGDRVIETDEQETERPTHLNLTYEEKQRDYDLGAQQAVRVDRPHYVPMTIASPLVLTATMAKRAVEVALAAYHQSRRSYKFSTGPKYIEYAPTDVVTVAGKNMRITSVAWRDGVVEFTAVAEEGGSYTSAATAQDIGFALPDLNRNSYLPTLLLLDLPILDADDTGLGVYAALYGPPASFRGGTVQSSTDGGATWADAGYFGSLPAVVGECIDVLGSGLETVLDYSRSLTVDLTTVAASLSAASDAELAVGANLAAVGSEAGWEIVQFKTATVVSGYRYTLTGLLRGLYGTGWMVGSHVAGEKFVLLSNLRGLQKIAVAQALVSTALSYRVAVDYSATVSAAVILAGGAIAWKPYAPTQIMGYRDSSRNLYISAKRNDRLAFTVKDVPDYGQVPMGEASESYEIDIRNALDTATLRTINATSLSAVAYSAANQTTDFGSAQNNIKVRIYQLGALGRGYMGAATL